MDQEPKTSLTRPHLNLLRFLEDLGYDVEIEKSFPPYWVDCYLTELHVAVEADGPQHKNRQKDSTRDDYIMATYGCPVVRLMSEELAGSYVDFLEALASTVIAYQWAESVVDRKTHARERGWQEW